MANLLRLDGCRLVSSGETSITVRTRQGVEQRSRGGHNFGKVPKTVLVTPEQLKEIEDDPRLNIIADKPDANKAKAKPKPKK